MSAGYDAAGTYAVPAARPGDRFRGVITIRHRPPVVGDPILVRNADELLDGWLHRLGPSATLLWWRLANTPTNTVVTLRDLSAWSGLADQLVRRALARLCRFSPVTDGEHSSVLFVPLSAGPAPRREQPEPRPGRYGAGTDRNDEERRT